MGDAILTSCGPKNVSVLRMESPRIETKFTVWNWYSDEILMTRLRSMKTLKKNLN
jgi:hypothetical protein